MSNSMVRDAFVKSVACDAPPVSFQSSQVSAVPKSSSPARAFWSAPGVLPSIHSSFVAEK